MRVLELSEHFLTYLEERNQSLARLQHLVLMCSSTLEDPLPRGSQLFKTPNFPLQAGVRFPNHKQMGTILSISSFSPGLISPMVIWFIDGNCPGPTQHST